MNKLTLSTIMALLLVTVSPTILASENDQNETAHQKEIHSENTGQEKPGHRANDAEHESENQVKIANQLAESLGITTLVAAPGHIEKHLLVYGRLVIPPAQQAQVRARFPGLVEEVLVDVGDQVEKGEVLARIESNLSLKSYAVRSPIKGRVLTKQATAGEITGDKPLFQLADTSSLWAELKVFPSQLSQVAVGQTVHLSLGDSSYDSEIRQLLPSANQQPYALALLSLPNQDLKFAPGKMVSARVAVAQAQVAVQVDNRALQKIKDETVVFVAVDGGYEKRVIKTGLDGASFTQVVDGLKAGERYAANNSYLLKAELMKAGAAHSH